MPVLPSQLAGPPAHVVAMQEFMMTSEQKQKYDRENRERAIRRRAKEIVTHSTKPTEQELGICKHLDPHFNEEPSQLTQQQRGIIQHLDPDPSGEPSQLTRQHFDPDFGDGGHYMGSWRLPYYGK